MKLAKKRTYKKGPPYFTVLDELCFQSKNLYNAILYTIRKHYFFTGNYLFDPKGNKLFTETNQLDD